MEKTDAAASAHADPTPVEAPCQHTASGVRCAVCGAPADGVDADHPARWGSLSDTKVRLWEGRSLELVPKAEAGPVHTMICGWAEIDGVHVDPLPAPDGTPSQLRRTINFDIFDHEITAGVARLPH